MEVSSADILAQPKYEPMNMTGKQNKYFMIDEEKNFEVFN